MDCNETREYLARHVKGELAEEVAREVDKHLRRCGPCRAEADREKALDRLLALYESREPGPEFDQELKQRLAAASRQDRGKPFSRKLFAGGAALAAAAAAVLGMYFLSTGPASRPEAEDMAISRDLEMYENLDVLEVLDALQDIQAEMDLEGGEPT